MSDIAAAPGGIRVALRAPKGSGAGGAQWICCEKVPGSRGRKCSIDFWRSWLRLLSLHHRQFLSQPGPGLQGLRGGGVRLHRASADVKYSCGFSAELQGRPGVLHFDPSDVAARNRVKL